MGVAEVGGMKCALSEKADGRIFDLLYFYLHNFYLLYFIFAWLGFSLFFIVFLAASRAAMPHRVALKI